MRQRDAAASPVGTLLLAGLLAALSQVGAAGGDNSRSVLLGGSFVEDGSTNELNVVRGGENITLTLAGTGPEGPLRYRADMVTSDEIFDAFRADLWRTTTGGDGGGRAGASGFVANVEELLRREGASLSADRMTLTLTLAACPRYQIHSEEQVYLHIPSVVLDCKCGFRIPVLSPLVVSPMYAPTPLLRAPDVICTSDSTVSAYYDDATPPLPVVAESYRIEWTVLSDSADNVAVADPTAAETALHGLHSPGKATIIVRFSVRDDARTATVVVERVASPQPAELLAPTMSVAGSSAYLNAQPVVGGGDDAAGSWTVTEADSPDVKLESASEPGTRITGLAGRTVLEWRVSGHGQCPETAAVLEIVSEPATVHAHPGSVCTAEAALGAAPPSLDGLKGRWTVVAAAAAEDAAVAPSEDEGPDVDAVAAAAAVAAARYADVRFVPSPARATVTVSGLPVGATTVAWTVSGDGLSSDTASATLVRRLEPRARILTREPHAFLGVAEVPLRAEPAADGAVGTWTVARTTCSPPPRLAEPATDGASSAEDAATATLLGCEDLTEACEVEVEWAVANPPCAAARDAVEIHVGPQPPTRPEVGPSPIVLCEDRAVELTANAAEVGEGVWTGVDPVDLALDDATNPAAVLARVRVGKTVVRWTIRSGEEALHADLEIVRHALADALLLRPEGARRHVEFCGRDVSLEADRRHFGPEDYGHWSVLEGFAGCETAADRSEEGCLDRAAVTLTGLRPGPSVAQWVVFGRKSLYDCPQGNAVNVTLQSWQYPRDTFVVHTTETSATVDPTEILLSYSERSPLYYPTYVRELAQLPGTWTLEELENGAAAAGGDSPAVSLAHNASSNVVVASGLPLGVTTILFQPSACGCSAACGCPVQLRVTITRGVQLACAIRKTGVTAEAAAAAAAAAAAEQGADDCGVHLHVVGATIDVTVADPALPLAAKTAWTVQEGRGPAFSDLTSPAVTVSELEEGSTGLRCAVSADVEAFAGACAATVTSWRARAPPPGHAVCYEEAEVEATPLPANAPAGLVAEWVVPEESAGLRVVQKDGAATATLSNLAPGENRVLWRLTLDGVSDEVAVVAVRHVLPRPFGAEGLRLSKTVVNLDRLTLPWDARPEFPSGPEGWRVEPGRSVSYDDEAGTVTFSGLRPGAPAVFSFTIKPAEGSTCAAAAFALEVTALEADIVGVAIESECALLAGATLALTAGAGLEWRRAPAAVDIETLVAALGPTLEDAFASAEVDAADAQTLRLRFDSAYLPSEGGAPQPIVVRDVHVPSALLASHVVTPRETVVSFRSANGAVATRFTVWPLQLTLRWNGLASTTEAQVNADGGAVSVAYQHANMAELRQRAASDAAVRAALLAAVGSKLPGGGARGRHGWDARRAAVVAEDSVAVEGDEVRFRFPADPWYTIGAAEHVHVNARLADVCGLPELPPHRLERSVRSTELTVADTPPTLSMRGTINECDFERRGAYLYVEAAGCSFAEGAELRPEHFVAPSSGAAPPLPKGWETMLRKALFNHTSVEADDPKRRTLRIEPVGTEMYEIPHDETLLLDYPAGLLVHPGTASGVVRASGAAVVSDTSLEVRGDVICANTLREAGHNVTLVLRGDAWSDYVLSESGAAMLVGAISGDRGVSGGWEAAMLRDILPKRLYRVVRVTDTELLVEFPPIASYTSDEVEVIGLKLPGAATACSKCLEKALAMQIFHPHTVVASHQELARPEQRTVRLTLPCASFATSFASADLRKGFYALSNVSNGFNENSDEILARNVQWNDERTATVTFRWPAAMNDSVPEELQLRLGREAVVPAARRVCGLGWVRARTHTHTHPTGCVSCHPTEASFCAEKQEDRVGAVPVGNAAIREPAGSPPGDCGLDGMVLAVHRLPSAPLPRRPPPPNFLPPPPPRFPPLRTHKRTPQHPVHNTAIVSCSQEDRQGDGTHGVACWERCALHAGRRVGACVPAVEARGPRRLAVHGMPFAAVVLVASLEGEARGTTKSHVRCWDEETPPFGVISE